MNQLQMAKNHVAKLISIIREMRQTLIIPCNSSLVPFRHDFKSNISSLF
jgi:hypothetical protein